MDARDWIAIAALGVAALAQIPHFITLWFKNDERKAVYRHRQFEKLGEEIATLIKTMSDATYRLLDLSQINRIQGNEERIATVLRLFDRFREERSLAAMHLPGPVLRELNRFYNAFQDLCVRLVDENLSPRDLNDLRRSHERFVSECRSIYEPDETLKSIMKERGLAATSRPKKPLSNETHESADVDQNDP